MQIVELRYSSSISPRTARNIPASPCYYQQTGTIASSSIVFFIQALNMPNLARRKLKPVHINIRVSWPAFAHVLFLKYSELSDY
jgi:hypothetical protein